MKAQLVALALFTATCSQSFAALVVSQDLGVLGAGGHTFEGGIAQSGGAGNNAEFYGTANQNYGSGELVISFTLEQQMETALQSISFSGGDPDAFLLGTTATTGVPGNLNATGWLAHAFLDGAIGSTAGFGVLAPGEYFISVEDWNGGPVTRVEYSLNLTVPPAPEPGDSPTDAISLGILGDEDTVINLDTFGSAIGDTELGIFDSAGNFLLTNDDAPTGGFQSSLAFSAPEGTYFVAAGQYNTIFSGNFGASGPSGGEITLNHNGGSSSGTIGAGGALWFSFGVVPEPSSMSLLALAGLTLLRRRRRG
ncbi:MAG: PEP-CTERM sorting domain-containing protein [Akkermansiaceae bacterium]